MGENKEKILASLKDKPLSTEEIALITGIPRPGNLLRDLLVERRVKQIGDRPSGRRPWKVWALT